MADSRARVAATAYVDAQHHRAHGQMKASHQRWERHELNHHMARINSIRQNEAIINARYVARSQTIENKKANMAWIIDRQHKSVAGRLDRMMPGGRARQAATWERLQERADQLQIRTARQHQAQIERHGQVLQAARQTRNQEWMGLRGMHRDALVDHQKQHIENRPNRVHARMREMQREKLMRLRPELMQAWRQTQEQRQIRTIPIRGLSRSFPLQGTAKRQFQHQAQQPASRTMQVHKMREHLKQAFRAQAQQPPSQTIQRAQRRDAFKQEFNQVRTR